MNSESLQVALRLGLVLLSATVIQRGLLSEVLIAGVALDLLMALAVGAGMALGADRGAVVGFCCGVLFDLLVVTPLGLSAFTFCLAGYATGRLYGPTVRPSRLLTALLVAGVSAVAVALYAILAEVMGHGGALSTRLVLVIMVVSAGNMVFSPLTTRAARWAWPTSADLRVMR